MKDPVRAPVVRYIYDLYLSTGLGLQLIRDKLNADPDKYPPPTPPDPNRALGVMLPQFHGLAGEEIGSEGRAMVSNCTGLSQSSAEWRRRL